MIKRVCSTDAFLDKNKGNQGELIEQEFGSVEDAKAAPLPAGYTFARISVDDGYYVYAPPTPDWVFHKTAKAV